MREVSTTQHLQPILDRHLAGDKTAKRELVEMAYERMLVIARKILRSFTPVDEETAAILHGCYQRIERALEDVKPKTMRDFFGLVALQIRRELLDMVRKEKRTPDGVPIGEGEGSGVVDPQDPDISSGAQGRQADVLTCLAKLPEELQEIVNLLFYVGLTQAEAAEIVGCHEDTVKRKWADARVKLQKCLEGYGPQKK